MRALLPILKPAVAACALLWATALVAEQSPIPALMQELSEATGPKAHQIAREIEIEWSKSGSASANLLLRRGNDALENQDFPAAIEHFSALTDHAPEFAEGWNGRAHAFFRMGRFGMALSDLEHTLALNPDHFGAIFGLGAIFEQLGRPHEAYDAYRILLGLYPAHEQAQEAIVRLAPATQGTSL